MKKLSEFYPYIFCIIAIFFATLLWDSLKFSYDESNIIQGVSYNKKINPYDNILKVLFFIFFPLFIFFFTFLKKNNLYSINPFNKNFFLNSNINSYEKNNLIDYKNFKIKLLTIVLIFLCLIEFISLDFNNLLSPVDIYHDGQVLVPSFNYLTNKNFWLSIHFDFGFGGNLRPLLFWKIFGFETIGAARIFDQSLILFNKICLIFISLKTIELLKVKKNKELFFLILALSAIQLSDYFVSLHGSGGPPFPIRMSIFLLFFLFLIDNLVTKNLIKDTILGFFSAISIFWFTDIAIYINFILLSYCLTLIFLKNFKKIYQIFAGIVFSWLCFVFFLGFDQINEVLYQISSNLSFIYYFNFIEFPKPFSDHYSSSRALKSLILIIINGILLINLCLKKKINLNINSKIYLIILFITSMVIFKSALIRSDAYHLKYTSGFILLLFIIQILYILFYSKFVENILKKIDLNKIIISSLILIIISSCFVVVKNIKIKSINANLKLNFKKIILQTDMDYLNFKPGTFSYGRLYTKENFEDDKKFINFYKKITQEDKCVQNFTEYLSLSYFIKKPTCTKYYNPQFIQHNVTDKKFLKEFKKKMPDYILFTSPIVFIDKYGIKQQEDLIKGVPRVESFIEDNYTFYKSYLNQWSIYKKKSKI
tara:strand:+ start:171 stop:2126 length:1956 start_codon:yes stop_codon:yes gene_type:complete